MLAYSPVCVEEPQPCGVLSDLSSQQIDHYLDLNHFKIDPEHTCTKSVCFHFVLCLFSLTKKIHDGQYTVI